MYFPRKAILLFVVVFSIYSTDTAFGLGTDIPELLQIFQRYHKLSVVESSAISAKDSKEYYFITFIVPQDDGGKSGVVQQTPFSPLLLNYYYNFFIVLNERKIQDRNVIAIPKEHSLYHAGASLLRLKSASDDRHKGKAYDLYMNSNTVHYKPLIDFLNNYEFLLVEMRNSLNMQIMLNTNIVVSNRAQYSGDQFKVLNVKIDINGKQLTTLTKIANEEKDGFIYLMEFSDVIVAANLIVGGSGVLVNLHFSLCYGIKFPAHGTVQEFKIAGLSEIRHNEIPTSASSDIAKLSDNQIVYNEVFKKMLPILEKIKDGMHFQEKGTMTHSGEGLTIRFSRANSQLWQHSNVGHDNENL